MVEEAARSDEADGTEEVRKKYSIEVWIERQLISQATLSVLPKDVECDIRNTFKEQLHHKNLSYFSLGNLLLSFVNVFLMHVLR
jgi:hypothetical protein